MKTKIIDPNTVGRLGAPSPIELATLAAMVPSSSLKRCVGTAWRLWELSVRELHAHRNPETNLIHLKLSAKMGK